MDENYESIEELAEAMRKLMQEGKEFHIKVNVTIDQRMKEQETAVQWNDVKKGDWVYDFASDANTYEVMDNKKGVIRMVRASNGDMGDMYIYKFRLVMRDGLLRRLTATDAQIKKMKVIAAAMGDIEQLMEFLE